VRRAANPEKKKMVIRVNYLPSSLESRKGSARSRLSDRRSKKLVRSATKSAATKTSQREKREGGKGEAVFICVAELQTSHCLEGLGGASAIFAAIRSSERRRKTAEAKPIICQKGRRSRAVKSRGGHCDGLVTRSEFPVEGGGKRRREKRNSDFFTKASGGGRCSGV